MSQKYLHHKSEESKVFDSDSQEYIDAQENGWSKERQFQDPVEDTEEDVAVIFTLEDVSDEDLLEEVEKRGLGPQAAIDALEDIVEEQDKEDEDTIVLSDLNVTELRKLAKEAGITGCSKMSKEDCITKLLEVEGA